MKIIFLDIDGVFVTRKSLNISDSARDKYGHLFDPVTVKRFDRIIRKTGAKIVISSAWRMSGLQVMQQMWKDRNLPGDVIDITSNIGMGQRGPQIAHWLDGNFTVDNYILIDDSAGGLDDDQLLRLVRTTFDDGLQDIHADMAIKLLNSDDGKLGSA